MLGLTKLKRTFDSLRSKHIYLKRLYYARRKLHEPCNDPELEMERKHKASITAWLISFYEGNDDAILEGPPERKLHNILSNSCNPLTPMNRVYAKVLYDWIEHKRIEGY